MTPKKKNSSTTEVSAINGIKIPAFKRDNANISKAPGKRKIPTHNFAAKKEVPFINTSTLSIKTLHEKNKVKAFEVTKRGITKTFTVVKHDILKAWKEVEKFTADVIKKK